MRSPIASFVLLTCSLMAAEFREHTIASGLRGGYQVVAADLNRDGKPDLIALASGLSELVWFENPSWERHVLATGLSRPINLAVSEPGPDGNPTIAVAQEFSMDARKSAGIVSVLICTGDPRRPWDTHEIDRLPTSHRLRWADIDGSARQVLVNAPLTGAAATAPDYRERVPLVFYRPGVWKRETISNDLAGVLHGIHIIDWDGDGRGEILTASFEGIGLFKLDGKWRRSKLAGGSPEPWPRCGSSDVTVGKLGKRRFLCAIEPWHGNQVAVYFEHGGRWQRQVIEDSIVEGHALAAADLDGNGRDSIIAGYRGKGRSVFIYTAEDRDGKRWARRVLDEGGMGAANCAVADLNGDGKLDIACIDSPNLKWYENVTRR
jgi:hypothetical protein